MEKAIAYEVQVKAFGGLSARTKRSLRAATKADGSSALRNRPAAGRGWFVNGTAPCMKIQVL